MAQFRMIADEDRQVSMLPSGELRKLEPDELFEVPDEVADSYECQPHYFELVSAPKPKSAKATAKTSKDGD